MGCMVSTSADNKPTESIPLTPFLAERRRLESCLALKQVRPRSHMSFGVAATGGFDFDDLVPSVVVPGLLCCEESAISVARMVMEEFPSLIVYEIAGMPEDEHSAFARAAAVTPACRFVDDIRVEVALSSETAPYDRPPADKSAAAHSASDPPCYGSLDGGGPLTVRVSSYVVPHASDAAQTTTEAVAGLWRRVELAIWSSSRYGSFDWGKNTARVAAMAQHLSEDCRIFRKA